MARNVRHFRAGCFASEALVERLGKSDQAGNRRPIQKLCLPAEWKRMPGNVAPREGLLHASAVGRAGLLQIFVNQPGASRPYVALFTRLAQSACELNRLWKVLFEILLHNGRL